MRSWIVAASALGACSGHALAGFGLEERVVVEGLTFPTGLSSPGPVDAVDAFPQLTFQGPMVLTHHTYRWNDAGREAHLLAGAESEVISVAGPSGNFDLTWNYPSQADCLTCHTAPAGRVLGVRSVSSTATSPIRRRSTTC